VFRTTSQKALQLAAAAFLDNDQLESAQEVLLKLQDWQALVHLHCRAEAWDRAFMTVKRCPEHEPALNETYADWLVTQGR
jgi:hypothetical protein